MADPKVDKRLLKSCKACGTDISRYSPFCRNCGHPQGSTLAIWLLVGFLLVMLAAYLAFTIYYACHSGSLT